MITTEELSLPDLPTKVRGALEEYLQHREQMRGDRRCIGIVITKLTVSHQAVRVPERTEAPAERHPHDPEYEAPEWHARGDSDEDITPWGV